MHKLLGLLAGILLAANAFSGEWISGSNGEREYKLYVPAAHSGGPLPLVVMLHGCTQGPDTFAESTRMNRYADSGRFLVLYPEQSMADNFMRCWNWFLPRNQARDSGEPAQIIALVDLVARHHGADRRRVYVAGLSAGASMAATLAACYPDVFAAAAIHDGTMYRAATGFFEASRVMMTGRGQDAENLGAQAWACGGKRSLAVPVMVWHGDGDNIVNRANGDLLVRQFLTLNDWADDGQANGSPAQVPTRQTGQVNGGHAYSRTVYRHRGRPLLEYYLVADMGHAWSGGTDSLLFSDGKGPDASLLIWDFFRQFSR